MDKSLFRLSDNEKADLLWSALNPNFTEENWEVDYTIVAVYDDYAVCFNQKCKKYERVYYTKDNDAETVSIGEFVEVKLVDITETEYAALEAMKAIGSYEQVNENYNANVEKIQTLEEEKTAFESQIAEKDAAAEAQKNEFEAQIAELTEAKEALQADLDAKTAEFASKTAEFDAEKVRLESEKNDIINENESLNAFKKNIENDQKLAILADFVSSLGENQVESFKKEIDKYSVDEFKKEVCAAAYESNHSIFSKQDEPIYPKVGGSIKPNTLEEYLDSYISKKGGNN